MTGSGPSPVDRLCQAAVAAGCAPSAVALWGVPGGEIHRVAVGGARLPNPSMAADEDVWYDLASLTKPLVVGTLSLLAIRDRRFEPGTAVADLVAGVSGHSVGGATIAQLLSHCSGLPAWDPLYARVVSPTEVVEAIASIETDRPPGAAVEYSCLGFILLGKALEAVFDEPLDRCFSERVLGPLGLEDALGYRPEPAIRRLAGGSVSARPETDMARERGFDRRSVPGTGEGLAHDGNARFLGGVAGNSGLFGSAAGVFALASEYTGRGSGFLHSDEIARATARVAWDARQVRGLGWQLAATVGCSAGRGLPDSAFGHVGFTGTSLWIDPGRDAVFVLLTNRCHPDYRDVDLHPLRRRFHVLAGEELSVRMS